MKHIAKFKNFKNKSTNKNKQDDKIEVEINGVTHIVKYHQSAEKLISSIVNSPIEILKEGCHGSLLSGTAHIEFKHKQ